MTRFHRLAAVSLMALVASGICSNISLAAGPTVDAAGSALISPDMSDGVLVNALSPAVRKTFSKLSGAERAEAIKTTRDRYQELIRRPEVTLQLGRMPASVRVNALRQLLSEVASEAADKKYNFCNVMLDREAAIAYSEDGVKKLAAAPRACPVGVSMEATIKYVNETLACAIGDPAYTRIVASDEASDMRKEMAGTKTAFKGGGVGLNLSADPAKTLPLSAEEKAAWDAERAARNKALDEVNPCSGKTYRSELSEEDRRKMAESDARVPSKSAFSGLIYHVVKGGPADKAGIADGDVVVKVDGQMVAGLENNVVIDKMRGALGSQVTITVMRGDQEITRTLTREAILPDVVWSRDLGDGVYSIVVTSFERQDTAFRIYDEVERLYPKARGFVFDVRNNPGGILDEGIEAVSWFIHDGVIFSQRERLEGDPANPKYERIVWRREGDHVFREKVDDKTGKVLERAQISFYETDPVTGKEKRRFTELPFFGGKPMAVVANGHSASAAEIFTGGVSENRGISGPASPAGDANAAGGNSGRSQGAEFIGEHTYGKFIGQTVAPGPEGTAVKATTFRYFSPKGEWLGDAWKVKIGLTPDLEVKMPDNAVPYTPSDAQINAAKDYIMKSGH